MTSSLRTGLPMGVICAPVGSLTGIWIATIAIGDSYGVFIAAAPAAAFLAGTLSWWLIVARSAPRTGLRGAAAGALAAFLGHFLHWYLLLAGIWLWALLIGPWETVSGPPIIH